MLPFDGLKNDAAPTEKFETAYGITQYTWAEALRRGVIQNKPISEATLVDAKVILKAMFYGAIRCGEMPAGCDLMVFNHAMACGVHMGAVAAQNVAGVYVDGQVGTATLAAIRAKGAKAFIDGMAALDEAYYARLANAPTYLRGWDRREEVARTTAYKMAGVA